MVQRNSPLLNTRWHRICLLSGFDVGEYGDVLCGAATIVGSDWNRNLLTGTPVLNDFFL